jgi:uncharacterized protein (TIGR02444 family)
MRPSGNPFWRFSLRVYRAPGVSEACLALQERCNADVNVLLFCGWTGRQGRELDQQRLRTAIGRVAAWQSQVIAPVRLARRALKQQHDADLAALANPFRRRLAAVELDLERVEQWLLAELAAQWPPALAASPPQAIGSNLSRYLALLAPAPAAQDLAHLACIAQACARPDPSALRRARAQAGQ